MTVEMFYRYDLNIFSFLFLTLLLFLIFLRKDVFNYERRLFVRLILFTMFLLVIEIMAWVFDGVVTNWGFFFNYIFNVLLILSEPLMAAFWLIYIDFKIYKSKERLRRRFQYMHLPLIGLIIIIVNFIYPIAFSLDNLNIYHRGDFLWVTLIGSFIYTFYSVVIAWQHREIFSGNQLVVITIFALLPVLGSFVQMFIYGLIVTWALAAVGVVLAYYMLETVSNNLDYLTRLHTRKNAEDYISNLIELEANFTVVMIDLDYFKNINDLYGHKVGDNVLFTFSRLLEKVFRNDFICRWGGDEFLVILESFDESSVNMYKEELLSEIASYDSLKAMKEIGFSFGPYLCDGNSNLQIDEIIVETDKKMYEDKARNKKLKRRSTD